MAQAPDTATPQEGPRHPEQQDSGFFQEGLDSLVSSIAALGDALGQALEPLVAEAVGKEETSFDWLLYSSPPSPPRVGDVETQPSTDATSEADQDRQHTYGIQLPSVATDTTLGASGRPPKRAKPQALTWSASMEHGTARATAVSKPAPAVPGAAKAAPKLTMSRTFVHRMGASVTKETELGASRSVANAMAVRAKQLQLDLRAARREVAQLQARVAELEASSQLKHELPEGQSWEPSEAEEQLREQVEHLLLEKAVLTNAKQELERENDQLHQLVEYYEHLHMNDENAGWEEAAVVVTEPDGMGYAVGELNAHLEALGFSPLDMDAGSASDVPPPDLYLTGTVSADGSDSSSGSRSGSFAEMSDGSFG